MIKRKKAKRQTIVNKTVNRCANNVDSRNRRITLVTKSVIGHE